MSLAPPPKDPAFEAKREDWIRCLDHKDAATGQMDRNCILAQVYEIVWSAGAYRVVLEARRIADKDTRGRIKLNGLTHRLLDRCFYQSQLVSVRRLMDNSALAGPKGVFSLKALVLDMKKHRRMFTRQNLFAAFGQVMDVDALQRASLQCPSTSGDSSQEETPWTFGNDPFFSKRLHDNMDVLCSVNAGSRQPGDVIAEAVFENLAVKLARTENICEHVNKFVAHAATPESRAQVDADSAKVTFAELWEAHEIICRMCQFIDCFLLRQNSHGFLVGGGDELFRYIDEPLATTERIPAIRKVWADYVKEAEDWGKDTVEWAMKSNP